MRDYSPNLHLTPSQSAQEARLSSLENVSNKIWISESKFILTGNHLVSW